MILASFQNFRMVFMGYCSWPVFRSHFSDLGQFAQERGPDFHGTLDTSILVILSYFLRLSRGCCRILLLTGLGSIFNFVPVTFRNIVMIFMGYGLGLASLISASFSYFLLIFRGT